MAKKSKKKNRFWNQNCIVIKLGTQLNTISKKDQYKNSLITTDAMREPHTILQSLSETMRPTTVNMREPQTILQSLSEIMRPTTVTLTWTALNVQDLTVCELHGTCTALHWFCIHVTRGGGTTLDHCTIEKKVTFTGMFVLVKSLRLHIVIDFLQSFRRVCLGLKVGPATKSRKCTLLYENKRRKNMICWPKFCTNSALVH